MFCNHCGAENNDSAQVCRSCGAVLTTEQNNAQPVQQQPVTYVNYANTPAGAPVKAPQPGKGFAIAAMVCGIVSFFCFGIVLGVLAIVFGVVAKKKGYMGAMATAGIVCGVVGLALYVVTMVFCGGCSTLVGMSELAMY